MSGLFTSVVFFCCRLKMSLIMFVIPLFLLASFVPGGVFFNVGHVTMPLFEMLTRDLPQDEGQTASDTKGDPPVIEYFAKLKVIDVTIADRLTLVQFFDDNTETFIKSARVLFNRRRLFTENLIGYNCTRYCYNASVADILAVTGWTEDRLDGKEQPTVTFRDIHHAVVRAIEERFCCNLTEIAITLALDPVDGVKQTAAYIDVWKRFVPHVIGQTIQCKANELQVTKLELAELLRSQLAALESYDLKQMDMHFFPQYEDLLRRKNLFENVSILTGGLISSYLSSPMAFLADQVSQFTPRDLQILYRWQTPKLFAIVNIPMSVFQTGCISVSIISDPLFSLSQTLFGNSTNLPNCDVAFLLSRSLDEVGSKYSISSLSNENVLDIFRANSGRSSWFEYYQLLQLSIDQGIWVETPSLNQIATYSGQALNNITANESIPIAISRIKTFNESLTLNTIMRSNYNSFLTRLLSTYGYNSSGLAMSAGINDSQLNSLTIQEAHNLLVDSIQTRYRISDVASLLGQAQVDTHVLINLPSFEWATVVEPTIEKAFSQSADAFSVVLSAGGVQIVTLVDGFPAIQVTTHVTYHTNRTSSLELADCLNRSFAGIKSMSLLQYHQFHRNNIVPLLRKKFKYENQSMQDLLTLLGQSFDDIKSSTVAEVITQLTGLTVQNLQCLYGLSTTFTSTDLAKTFQNANETRLCNDFLGRTLFDIVTIISQIPDKVCCKYKTK